MSIQNEIKANATLSKIQARIQAKFENQTAKGLAKYGHTVQPKSLEDIEWIDHAIEESIDLIVYLECIKERLKNG